MWSQVGAIGTAGAGGEMGNREVGALEEPPEESGWTDERLARLSRKVGGLTRGEVSKAEQEASIS